MTDAVPSTRLCRRCGQLLYLDRESALQMMRLGYVGGRFFCRLGCTDVWVKAPLPPSPRPVGPPDGRGKYDRHSHTFVCQVCGGLATTRGLNTRRCRACAKQRQRERDARRYAAKLAAKRAK